MALGEFEPFRNAGAGAAGQTQDDLALAQPGMQDPFILDLSLLRDL